MLPTFFLPAAAGRILKMYTHACTHKKPSQRAGYIKKMYTFAGIFFRWFYVYTCIRSFPPLPILPAFFRSRHTHKNTPLPLSPTSAIYFFAPLFLRKPKRQTKVAVKKKRCFRKPTAVFSAHRKKQKKNKEKQRVNKDKYTKIYKFYFQIKKIEKMDILQEQNEKK